MQGDGKNLKRKKRNENLFLLKHGDRNLLHVIDFYTFRMLPGNLFYALSFRLKYFNIRAKMSDGN